MKKNKYGNKFQNLTFTTPKMSYYDPQNDPFKSLISQMTPHAVSSGYITQSPGSHPQDYFQSANTLKIKEGDPVIYKGQKGVIGEISPDGFRLFFWGNSDGLDGSSGNKSPSSLGYKYSYALDYSSWPDIARFVPPVIKFDPSALELLILEQAAKDEIMAVLEQHKNSKKIFEDWGLGETIKYGKGMSFLFYGPPGTGKTWAAHCIAQMVGQEMIVLSGAEIHSSEPGAANRNIQAAFASAKEENKILFLDECDSLITSRADVGMIIGGEINTLLTEIEKSEGIVILTTNQVESLDEALERRLGLIIEFPEPGHAQRVAIFEKLLPSKMPLAKGVTPLALGDHKLTGGQIKNVILQAARLAVASKCDEVSMKHFESAIKRIHASKSLLGSASRYRQNIIKDDFKKTRS